jgi:rod shape-determining protein MreC
MHDRAVRRRRAVLVALIAASLVLLTAYSGESSDGRLHSVQRGVFGALSPIQEGASRVLKPFRDLFGWFGDTIDAKDQRDKAIAERDAYRTRLAQAQNRLSEAEQRAALNTRDTTGGMGKYGPVDARVVTRSRTSWYQRLTINKGSGDGIRRGDPVINGAGLIGKVAETTGGDAVVALITDPEFGTGGITGTSREPGSVQVAVGEPGNLLFEPIDADARIREGELVYTAGTAASRTELASRYPRAIPIGVVTRIDLGDGDLDKRIHIQPAADLKRTDMVQVLTEPHADLEDQG